MSIDRNAAERAVRDLLVALGHAPESDPELAHTPRRVVDAYALDLLAGYGVDVDALFEHGRCGTADAHQGIVALGDLSVATVCPHHLMPALGTATVAYAPGRSLVGLGSLAALVDTYARRLTLQERIGQEVVRALIDKAGARGAYCRLVIRHTCLSARGARQGTAFVSTVAVAGVIDLADVEAAIARGP